MNEGGRRPEPDGLAARQTRPAAGVFPAAVSWRVVVGAAAWTLTVAFFVVQVVAQARFAPAFDPVTNLISDLGNTACRPALCSPLHGIVNATFVVVGALHWLGAIATLEAWPRRRWGGAGRSLLALAGVGLILAGLAPENERAAAHANGALLGLICLNLAMIVLGGSIVSARTRLGELAVGSGVVGLVGFVLFLSGAVPRGIAERVADYPSAAMVVVFGVVVLVAAAKRGRGRGGSAAPS